MLRPLKNTCTLGLKIIKNTSVYYTGNVVWKTAVKKIIQHCLVTLRITVLTSTQSYWIVTNRDNCSLIPCVIFLKNSVKVCCNINSKDHYKDLSAQIRIQEKKNKCYKIYIS